MKRALPLALFLVGFSPFQAESPEVSRGNQALRAGDPTSALEHYDRAQSKLGNRPELDYDRGNALFAQKRYEEARDAYKKALTGPEGLKSRDYYNLGNALARLKSDEEALDAFRKALAVDPQNEDARYNLEVMLRRKQAQQQPQQQQQKDQKPQKPKSGDSPDGGTQTGKDEKKDERDGGAQKDARDGGTDGADAGRQQERDAGADPRDGGPRPQPEDSRDGGQPEQAQQSGSQDGGHGDQGGRQVDAAQMSRQDAEKLLDAMRARERNMPMSPAGQNPRRARSSNAAKDW